jgi:geranylgeranyl pyrophosphate synthase
LGKSILADLDTGAVSLPIIYLAQMLPARQRARLFAPFTGRAARGSPGMKPSAREPVTDPAFLARLAKTAESYGAIAKAENRARTFARRAQEAIAKVSMNGLGDAYHQLAEHAVTRRS